MEKKDKLKNEKKKKNNKINNEKLKSSKKKKSKIWLKSTNSSNYYFGYIRWMVCI